MAKNPISNSNRCLRYSGYTTDSMVLSRFRPYNIEDDRKLMILQVIQDDNLRGISSLLFKQTTFLFIFLQPLKNPSTKCEFQPRFPLDSDWAENKQQRKSIKLYQCVITIMSSEDESSCVYKRIDYICIYKIYIMYIYIYYMGYLKKVYIGLSPP